MKPVIIFMQVYPGVYWFRYKHSSDVYETTTTSAGVSARRLFSALKLNT